MAGQKNKVTAGVLGILLGGIGVHKFYLGQTGMGILYLIFFWTFVPAIIGLIEGIIYLTMSDEAFDAKFNGGLTTSIKPQTPQRMCIGCGAQIDMTFRACPHCGKVVPTVPAQ